MSRLCGSLRSWGSVWRMLLTVVETFVEIGVVCHHSQIILLKRVRSISGRKNVRREFREWKFERTISFFILRQEGTFVRTNKMNRLVEKFIGENIFVQQNLGFTLLK